MNIKQRIEALRIAFDGISQIPNNVFILACTGIINNSTTLYNIDKTI
ncbi:MAG: hypothetical protein [Bacteriophage sp.]|nr:MAG: hypothetical protein [Bacteriophage sp.]